MHYLIDQTSYKSISSSFYRELKVKSALNFTISSHWKVILGVQIDEYTRKVIPALRNIISSLQGDFIRSSWRISRRSISASSIRLIYASSCFFSKGLVVLTLSTSRIVTKLFSRFCNHGFRLQQDAI